MFKSEYELIESILFKTKMDLTYEKYSELLDSFYTKIENHNFEKLNVTIYVANDKTLKVVIEDDNKLQIEMDYIDINENENGAGLYILNNDMVFFLFLLFLKGFFLDVLLRRIFVLPFL